MSNGMSKREKSLVAVALTLIVGVGYYTLAYEPLSEKLDQKRNEKTQIEAKYQKAMDDIHNLETNKANLRELLGSTTVKSSGFYPKIIQEKLILELESMISTSQLKVTSMTWGEQKTQPIEAFKQETEQQTGVTLDRTVDSYKGDKSSSSTDSKSTNKTTTNTASSDSPACETISCTINVQSSYDSIKKFMQSIEASGRNIAITNTNLAPINEGTINGTIVLEFYGLPKVDDSDDNYDLWSYNKDVKYGKDQLFGKGAATGAYENSTSDATAVAYDIIGILKSSSSELPPVTLGKAGDDTFASYLYGKENDSKEVEIEFTEEDGKLYYSLKVGSEKYPTDSTKGKEFVPYGTDILIAIQSEARSGSSDTSEISLNVINNTSKTVNVKIMGDDKSNPRVPKPSSEGSGTVNWINE
ncbi:MAG: hypothetical protein SOV35_06380 [Clostridium sp.]|nr:hypothetical protein [Clostridium sp.]